MDYIDSFEEICSTTRSNGVPSDFLKCKLFAISLTDKAHRWLKSLPPDSLTTWDECKAAFLSDFYTKSRTKELKAKITMFTQEEEETFSDACNRFKEYTREWPHQGFSESQLLCTFYEGVDWDVRMILGTANNGNFLTRTEEDAKVLLNNFASGSLDDKPRNACIDSRQTKQIERLTKQLEEFATKNREMASNLDKPRSTLYVCEAEQDYTDEINGKNKYEAGTQGKSKIEDILENILASQKRIETRCDILEEQLKRPEPINALILRSGKALDEPYQQPQGEESIAAKESLANVQSNDGNAEGADDGTDQPILMTDPSSNTTEPVKHNKPKSYTPKVPYPDPARKIRKKKEQEKCAEIVRGINVTIQLQDAIEVAPAFRTYMKDIVTNKVTTEEGVAW